MNTISDETADKHIATMNSLSENAYALVCSSGFRWLGSTDGSYKSALMVATIPEHDEAFIELTKVGFVWMDTERGHVGFRSSQAGAEAHAVATAINEHRRKSAQAAKASA